MRQAYHKQRAPTEANAPAKKKTSAIFINLREVDDERCGG
jgi:hypothetical protein